MRLSDARRHIAIVERLIGFPLSRKWRIEFLIRSLHVSTTEATMLVLALEGTLKLTLTMKFCFEDGRIQKLYGVLRETDGADLIDFALFAGFVAVAIVAAVPGVLPNISHIFSN
jgi:Flp pilus assembly pilin Flp